MAVKVTIGANRLDVTRSLRDTVETHWASRATRARRFRAHCAINQTGSYATASTRMDRAGRGRQSLTAMTSQPPAGFVNPDLTPTTLATPINGV